MTRMQDLTTPRDINKQSPLAKTNKQRLQKIPVVEIALIIKYYSNWTIFCLHMFIRIRHNFINISLSFKINVVISLYESEARFDNDAEYENVVISRLVPNLINRKGKLWEFSFKNNGNHTFLKTAFTMFAEVAGN